MNEATPTKNQPQTVRAFFTLHELDCDNFDDDFTECCNQRIVYLADLRCNEVLRDRVFARMKQSLQYHKDELTALRNYLADVVDPAVLSSVDATIDNASTTLQKALK